MTERARGKTGAPVPPSQPELIEVPRNPNFDRLFSTILQVSRKREEPVYRHSVNITVMIPGEASKISVSVNPSFADEQGRPVFLTLDAYVGQLHVQQVSARAFWSPFDVPTAEIDNAYIGSSGKKFDEESLANLGVIAVSARYEDQKGEHEEASTKTPQSPRSYN